jgi:hypothetical protein
VGEAIPKLSLPRHHLFFFLSLSPLLLSPICWGFYRPVSQYPTSSLLHHPSNPLADHLTTSPINYLTLPLELDLMGRWSATRVSKVEKFNTNRYGRRLLSLFTLGSSISPTICLRCRSFIVVGCPPFSTSLPRRSPTSLANFFYLSNDFSGQALIWSSETDYLFEPLQTTISRMNVMSFDCDL